MKKLFSLLILAMVCSFANAPSILAGDTTCSGTLGAISVDGVIVRDSCVLQDTKVRGNVTVQTGGELSARGAQIAGNVQAEEALRVELIEGTWVDGDVQIKLSRDKGEIRILDATIGGNLQLEDNNGVFDVRRNMVHGDLQVFKNRAEIAIVSNDINGNLQCKENDPAPRGGQNRVGGNKEDQCRWMDPPLATVPDVVGLHQTEAETTLTDVYLTVGTVGTAYSVTVPAGHVMEQAPTAGTIVEEGTSIDLTVSLGPPLPLVSLSVEPDVIHIGNSATLTWPSTYADTCWLGPGIGPVNRNGALTVSPLETTTYTFTASGPGGDAYASAGLTVTNVQPSAHAQSISTNEDTAVQVNLTGSDADGDPLSFQVVSSPAHGVMTGTAPALTYTPDADVNGTVQFTFLVNDGWVDSEPATVTIVINPINDVPVAHAGPDQAVFKRDTVVLDGSNSSDIEGDALTYQWSFLSVPQGSQAAFSDPSAVQPTFVADVSGVFEISLVVNDGSIDSQPDTVIITAEPRMVIVPDLTGMSQNDAETEL
ncbi:MAG: PASTA domain-containing protein, partial [Deltaproteobacteria bacterium]|nr:PASTA domain-containing protein [Deltaproteobacteria bacterium]